MTYHIQRKFDRNSKFVMAYVPLGSSRLD